MLASCTTTSSLLVFSSSTPDGRSGATQPRQGRAVKLSQCGYTSEMDLIIGAQDPITDSKAYLSQTRVFLKVFLIWLYAGSTVNAAGEMCAFCLIVWTGRASLNTVCLDHRRWVKANTSQTTMSLWQGRWQYGRKMLVHVPSRWINSKATLVGPNCLHYWLAIACDYSELLYAKPILPIPVRG